jgi:hypothetical protein
VKNIRAAQRTGRLSTSSQTLRSRPKGVARALPNTLLPTSDQARIASVKTSEAKKRLRISSAIPTIEWPE